MTGQPDLTLLDRSRPPDLLPGPCTCSSNRRASWAATHLDTSRGLRWRRLRRSDRGRVSAGRRRSRALLGRASTDGSPPHRLPTLERQRSSRIYPTSSHCPVNRRPRPAVGQCHRARNTHDSRCFSHRMCLTVVFERGRVYVLSWTLHVIATAPCHDAVPCVPACR